MRIWIRACLTVIFFALTATAAAELRDLPPELENWQAWVMHDTEFLACPVRLHADPKDSGSYLCAWPGILELAAGASGGRFDIQWQVFDQSWLPLPGGARAWPMEVRVDGIEVAGEAALLADPNRPTEIAEAVLKVLGTGWRDGIAWTDIEVVREPSGNIRTHRPARSSSTAARIASAPRFEVSRGIELM